MAGDVNFRMPDSWYEPPNEIEHDDECEMFNEDLIGDPDADDYEPPECKCIERLEDRLAEGPDYDEDEEPLDNED